MPNKEDFSLTLTPVAFVENDFTGSFGIPRQSGLAKSIVSQIVFCDGFCDKNALRGIEQYSHLWLIWGFSENFSKGFSPTVRPPKLGGNTRVGVFATRSPYRPNPIGLSSVKLEGIEKRPNLGTVLIVSGADLMDGTPIYDIKPYLSFTDSHPDAKNGFAGERLSYALKVEIQDELIAMIPQSKRDALTESLSQDPRPAYITEPDTPFGFEYAGFDVRFKVNGDTLTVYEIIRL